MRFGLVGYPVAHSLSPLLHNAGFNELGLNHSYELLACKDISKLWPKLKDFSGVNITIPHKESVLDLVNELSPEVETIGAANTILFKEGRAIAFNTDIKGFIHSLDFELSGKNIVVFGAGGAAKAIISGLLQEGISSVTVVNRQDRELPFGLKVHPYSEEVISKADILINATPVDPLVDLSITNRSTVVIDLRYTDTGFLNQASLLGRKVIDGRGMLAWQAAFAWEIWFGFLGPVKIFQDVLERRQ